MTTALWVLTALAFLLGLVIAIVLIKRKKIGVSLFLLFVVIIASYLVGGLMYVDSLGISWTPLIWGALGYFVGLIIGSAVAVFGR